ncbi:MAG: hypothetical protein O7D31_10350, partial [Alphaproteobacteria bacterium]|nr:hypothetical protein [Alphaproteobacteria bacterium]
SVVWTIAGGGDWVLSIQLGKGSSLILWHRLSKARWLRHPSVNVRFWLQADIQSPEIEVCFTPKSGHSPDLD